MLGTRTLPLATVLCMFLLLDIFRYRIEKSFEDTKQNNAEQAFRCVFSETTFYFQAQPQLNSISTQSTELGTTQLKLVLSMKSG